jgi:hypothetical protein
MQDSKPVASPMVANQHLSKLTGDICDGPYFYHTIVGGLQYVTIIRHDIAFAVNNVA